MAKQKYRTRKSGVNGFVWIFGLVAVGVLAMWALAKFTGPDTDIAGLEKFASEGSEHVTSATEVTYKTDPPTSGAHYSGVTATGFHANQGVPGEIVHALEHGRIVIYYDPKGTPDGVVDQLKQYAKQYPGEWDGVVVLPRFQKEQVIMTAWRHMLRLDTWDQQRAEKFIDAFRGRGPENPVR